MSRMKTLQLLLAMAVQVSLASSTVTYAVGNCQPKLTSFTTINSALGATPAPNVVEVCPGTYPEQIVITNPVTLEGISAGGSTGATIAVPAGGLVDNFANLAVQVLVGGVNGEVNLRNLTVEGTGNNVLRPGWIVGVLYYASSGVMNHLTVENQNGDGIGVGIWAWTLAGGNQTVTVENSNVRDFDLAGILVEGDSTTADLTAIIKGNYLSSSFSKSTGISLDVESSPGSGLLAPFVSGNVITGASTGVGLGGGQGSVTANTVIGVGGVGIADGNSAAVDGVSVTSNTIFNAGISGVQVISSVAPVTGNNIVAAGYGIDFQCTAGSNVHTNTILGSANGMINVPSGVFTTNAYYNVATIRSGGC